SRRFDPCPSVRPRALQVQAQVQARAALWRQAREAPPRVAPWACVSAARGEGIAAAVRAMPDHPAWPWGSPVLQRSVWAPSGSCRSCVGARTRAASGTVRTPEPDPRRPRPARGSPPTPAWSAPPPSRLAPESRRPAPLRAREPWPPSARPRNLHPRNLALPGSRRSDRRPDRVERYARRSPSDPLAAITKARSRTWIDASKDSRASQCMTSAPMSETRASSTNRSARLRSSRDSAVREPCSPHRAAGRARSMTAFVAQSFAVASADIRRHLVTLRRPARVRAHARAREHARLIPSAMEAPRSRRRRRHLRCNTDGRETGGSVMRKSMFWCSLITAALFGGACKREPSQKAGEQVRKAVEEVHEQQKDV